MPTVCWYNTTSISADHNKHFIVVYGSHCTSAVRAWSDVKARTADMKRVRGARPTAPARMLDSRYSKRMTDTALCSQHASALALRSRGLVVYAYHIAGIVLSKLHRKFVTESEINHKKQTTQSRLCPYG